ncbi:MAG: LLM class flavin-dependent oxidoreductase [Actinomycetia bacterium]|nr:LLM class flavin-dependent oxidoreductase [Actinomycetes bacterium]MCP4959900.1 LLM class flavin-dependent oxidoreductase [Actinomycetes bacterium]
MVGVGLSLTSAFGSRTPEDAIEQMVARTRAGASAGLDFLTVGDHHNTRHLYVQNVPIMGRLVAEWPADPDRPIGCLFLLPLWNPLLVAEQVSTLAAMHPGSFVLQTGIGWGESQFAAMNAHFNRRGHDLEESVEVIAALFSGESVDSQRYGITGARLAMKPTRPVQWWMGGGVDIALDRVARLGASLYVAPGSPATVGDVIDRFMSICARRSHEPQRVVVRQDVFVADDEVTARRQLDQIFASGYRGMAPAEVAVGTVAQVTEHFAELSNLGASDIAVRQMSVSDDLAMRSVELLGQVRASLT